MALIAVYLGEVNEDRINNMSGIFLDDVMEALGMKLNYDAIVNYAGNSYFEKSWDLIQENNPLTPKSKQSSHDKTGIASMIEKMNLGAIKIKKLDEKDNKEKVNE